MNSEEADAAPKKQPEVLRWRKAIAGSSLPSAARHVAHAISLYMNRSGGSAFPGAARLAIDTALSLRTVRTALSALEAEGWLIVVQRGGSAPGKPRTATEYCVGFPTTSAGDAPVQEMHSCSSKHRPVHLTTPTSARDAPQVGRKEPVNKPIASISVEAGEDTLRSALIEAIGWDVNSITKSGNGALAKAVKDIAEVGGRAGDVQTVVARYRKRYPEAGVTPSAIAKHWASFIGSSATTSLPPRASLSEAQRAAAAVTNRTSNREEAVAIIRSDYEHVDFEEAVTHLDLMYTNAQGVS